MAKKNKISKRQNLSDAGVSTQALGMRRRSNRLFLMWEYLKKTIFKLNWDRQRMYTKSYKFVEAGLKHSIEDDARLIDGDSSAHTLAHYAKPPETALSGVGQFIVIARSYISIRAALASYKNKLSNRAFKQATLKIFHDQRIHTKKDPQIRTWIKEELYKKEYGKDSLTAEKKEAPKHQVWLSRNKLRIQKWHERLRAEKNRLELIALVDKDTKEILYQLRAKGGISKTTSIKIKHHAWIWKYLFAGFGGIVTSLSIIATIVLTITNPMLGLAIAVLTFTVLSNTITGGQTIADNIKDTVMLPYLFSKVRKLDQTLAALDNMGEGDQHDAWNLREVREKIIEFRGSIQRQRRNAAKRRNIAIGTAVGTALCGVGAGLTGVGALLGAAAALATCTGVGIPVAAALALASTVITSVGITVTVTGAAVAVFTRHANIVLSKKYKDSDEAKRVKQEKTVCPQLANDKQLKELRKELDETKLEGSHRTIKLVSLSVVSAAIACFSPLFPPLLPVFGAISAGLLILSGINMAYDLHQRSKMEQRIQKRERILLEKRAMAKDTEEKSSLQDHPNKPSNSPRPVAYPQKQVGFRSCASSFDSSKSRIRYRGISFFHAAVSNTESQAKAEPNLAIFIHRNCRSFNFFGAADHSRVVRERAEKIAELKIEYNSTRTLT